MSKFDAVATQLQRRLAGDVDHAEQLRQERHHEVLLRVVDRLVVGQDLLNSGYTWKRPLIAEVARVIADAAYPPPKEPDAPR